MFSDIGSHWCVDDVLMRFCVLSLNYALSIYLDLSFEALWARDIVLLHVVNRPLVLTVTLLHVVNRPLKVLFPIPRTRCIQDDELSILYQYLLPSFDAPGPGLSTPSHQSPESPAKQYRQLTIDTRPPCCPSKFVRCLLSYLPL